MRRRRRSRGRTRCRKSCLTDYRFFCRGLFNGILFFFRAEPLVYDLMVSAGPFGVRIMLGDHLNEMAAGQFAVVTAVM